MANITVDFLGSSRSWSNWRKKYFGGERLSTSKENSWIQTKDLVISSTLFSHFLPLSIKGQRCNCTLIICSIITHHLLQVRHRQKMKNMLKHKLQQHRYKTAISCILLAAFSCKRKKRKQESHVVYEAISETEALKKQTRKNAYGFWWKKKITYTDLGVEGIHLKKCSRWRAE